jgi:hypothetical protein
MKLLGINECIIKQGWEQKKLLKFKKKIDKLDNIAKLQINKTVVKDTTKKEEEKIRATH